MFKYLIPPITRSDLPPMMLASLIGGLIAGGYGILHDQITFSISPEYFTKLKFAQFHYADMGLGDRFFAGTIGFLATFWVGVIVAWFLSRRLLPNQPRAAAFGQIRRGFLITLVCGLSFGLGGFAYGLSRGPDADYSDWLWVVQEFQVKDLPAFVHVAYIHNAGYLGGFVGLILALATVRPQREGCDHEQDT